MAARLVTVICPVIAPFALEFLTHGLCIDGLLAEALRSSVADEGNDCSRLLSL